MIDGLRIPPNVAAICAKEQYDEAVERTQLFFEGRNDELIQRLTDSMHEAAQAERFEEAAHLRDAARTVQTLRDRQQKIATARLAIAMPSGSTWARPVPWCTRS